jgi:hypothetical protein
VPINFFAHIQILGLKIPGSLNFLIPISISISTRHLETNPAHYFLQ